jgi:hypothetical protein
MTPFIAGLFTGSFVGVLAVALGRAAHECDVPQLPTLGKGTWLVSIDQYGELTRCEPHTIEAAFRRLDEAMREEQ